MCIRIMTRVWDEGPSDRAELLVLLALADFADENGYCWPSIATISAKARLGERGTQKVLRRLEETGYVTVQVGGGRHGCNAYIINPTPARDAGNSGGSGGQIDPEPGSPPTNEKHRTGFRGGEPPFAKPRTAVHPNHHEPSLRRRKARERDEAVDKSGAEPASQTPDLRRRVMAARGVVGPCPSWWQAAVADRHISGWTDGLGLTADEIVSVAASTAETHPEPPDGPKALDAAMARFARQKAALADRAVKSIKAATGPQSLDDLPDDQRRIVLDRIIPAARRMMAIPERRQQAEQTLRHWGQLQ